MRRGIIDYPTEHEILSLNPPLPIPPRTPVRIRKKLLADKRRRVEKLKKEQKRKGITDAEMREQQNSPPTLDKLVKGYLRRHEDKLRQGMSPSQSRKEEEYYSQLLLGQSAASAASGGNPATKSKFLSPSSLRTAMGRKSMLVENAYAFALRQQQIMLQEEKPATEQDSIEKVEQILREEARANRQGGRKATQEIEEWRTEQSTDDAAGAGKKKEEDDDDSTLPSILHDRPRSIRALNIWSSRLQSIPYSRWTIGAATALDHWIAREVLQMDENTWQLVLAGGGTDAYVEGMETLPGGETKMGLMDRMRDIVTVRGALFPETLSDSGSSSGGRGSITGELDDELSETDKSIDELLASLGSSVDDDDSDLFKFDDEDDEVSGDDDNDNDEQIESIMDELQVWRERNESSPYESWDNDRKSEFDVSITVLMLHIMCVLYYPFSSSLLAFVKHSNGLRNTLRLCHRKLSAAVLTRMPPASLYSLKDLLIATNRKNSGVRFVLNQKLSYSWRIIANMLKRSCKHLMMLPVKLMKRNNPCQSCRPSSMCHLNVSYKRSWIWVRCALSSMITRLVLNAMPSSRSTLLSCLRD